MRFIILDCYDIAVARSIAERLQLRLLGVWLWRMLLIRMGVLATLVRIRRRATIQAVFRVAVERIRSITVRILSGYVCLMVGSTVRVSISVWVCNTFIASIATDSPSTGISKMGRGRNTCVRAMFFRVAVQRALLQILISAARSICGSAEAIG